MHNKSNKNSKTPINKPNNKTYSFFKENRGSSTYNLGLESRKICPNLQSLNQQKQNQNPKISINKNPKINPINQKFIKTNIGWLLSFMGWRQKLPPNLRNPCPKFTKPMLLLQSRLAAGNNKKEEARPRRWRPEGRGKRKKRELEGHRGKSRRKRKMKMEKGKLKRQKWENSKVWFDFWVFVFKFELLMF